MPKNKDNQPSTTPQADQKTSEKTETKNSAELKLPREINRLPVLCYNKLTSVQQLMETLDEHPPIWEKIVSFQASSQMHKNSLRDLHMEEMEPQVNKSNKNQSENGDRGRNRPIDKEGEENGQNELEADFHGRSSNLKQTGRFMSSRNVHENHPEMSSPQIDPSLSRVRAESPVNSRSFNPSNNSSQMGLISSEPNRGVENNAGTVINSNNEQSGQAVAGLSNQAVGAQSGPVSSHQRPGNEISGSNSTQANGGARTFVRTQIINGTSRRTSRPSTPLRGRDTNSSRSLVSFEKEMGARKRALFLYEAIKSELVIWGIFFLSLSLMIHLEIALGWVSIFGYLSEATTFARLYKDYSEREELDERSSLVSPVTRIVCKYASITWILYSYLAGHHEKMWFGCLPLVIFYTISGAMHAILFNMVFYSDLYIKLYKLLRLAFGFQFLALVSNSFNIKSDGDSNVFWISYLIFLVFVPTGGIILLYTISRKIALCWKGKYKEKVKESFNGYLWMSGLVCFTTSFMLGILYFMVQNTDLADNSLMKMLLILFGVFMIFMFLTGTSLKTSIINQFMEIFDQDSLRERNLTHIRPERTAIPISQTASPAPRQVQNQNSGSTGAQPEQRNQNEGSEDKKSENSSSIYSFNFVAKKNANMFRNLNGEDLKDYPELDYASFVSKSKSKSKNKNIIQYQKNAAGSIKNPNFAHMDDRRRLSSMYVDTPRNHGAPPPSGFQAMYNRQNRQNQRARGLPGVGGGTRSIFAKNSVDSSNRNIPINSKDSIGPEGYRFPNLPNDPRNRVLASHFQGSARSIGMPKGWSNFRKKATFDKRFSVFNNAPNAPINPANVIGDLDGKNKESLESIERFDPYKKISTFFDPGSKKSRKKSPFSGEESIGTPLKNKPSDMISNLNDSPSVRQIRKEKRQKRLQTLIDRGSLPKQEQTDSTCIICFENLADSIFNPCGHGGICFPCAKNYIENNSSVVQPKCHYCRQPIKKVLKIDAHHKYKDIYRVVDVFNVSFETEYSDEDELNPNNNENNNNENADGDNNNNNANNTNQEPNQILEELGAHTHEDHQHPHAHHHHDHSHHHNHEEHNHNHNHSNQSVENEEENQSVVQIEFSSPERSQIQSSVQQEPQNPHTNSGSIVARPIVIQESRSRLGQPPSDFTSVADSGNQNSLKNQAGELRNDQSEEKFTDVYLKKINESMDFEEEDLSGSGRNNEVDDGIQLTAKSPKSHRERNDSEDSSSQEDE